MSHACRRIIIVLILIFRIYLIIRRYNWILIWSGIEINILSFLSLNKNFSCQGEEFEFKYFIIQFIGSTMFLIRGIFDRRLLIFFSLRMKLLLVPFVFWILPCLNWIHNTTLIFLLTLQKIGPFFIIIRFIKISNFIFFFVIFNLIVSLFFIYKKNSVKIVMVFSSTIQLSIIITLLNINLSISFVFFLFYIISLFIILILFYFNSFSFKKSIAIFIIRGFPPFFLFFIKLWAVKIMIIINIKIIRLFIILISRIITYVYIKMLLKFFFFNFHLKINWFFNQPKFWLFFIILGLIVI